MTAKTPTAADLIRVSFFFYGHPRTGTVVKINRRTVEVVFRMGRKDRPADQYTTRATIKLDSNVALLPGLSRDAVTARETAFPTFGSMVNALGGYRPTLLGEGWQLLLALTYDGYQFRRADPRRAYRRTVAGEAPRAARRAS